MKKIHFGNLKRKERWLIATLGIIGLSLIINGAFEFVEFENPKTNNYLNATGFLIIAIISTQMFWYQNYVQWNNRGILIKVKSLLGKNIKFKEIKSSELTDKKLVITETFGNKIVIDLSHIVESDTLKLHEIINKNTIANV
ncbi:hypothetical protein [Gelidibacter pelagius]|uniref:PH (Pleckstrin Homology) domain-containing protein n=1 Tax=Gelidibacter pelagius TaxID=2819985 RepID=A0ABS3SW99_9FLAO|nr:hypothetical protein [Gelidibacter pelagius]MBO3099972.1 hypothetical protein [Gelidibacter pelagius]